MAERRAFLERVAQHRLEGDDWAVVDALLSELIVQAELGQDWLTSELPEEEEASEGLITHGLLERGASALVESDGARGASSAPPVSAELRGADPTHALPFSHTVE